MGRTLKRAREAGTNVVRTSWGCGTERENAKRPRNVNDASKRRKPPLRKNKW
jgi:pyruvate kinase